jgi:hypothetical protein
MELGVVDLASASAGRLTHELQMSPRKWFRTHNIQARMALLPVRSLPPGTTMTLYTVERALVWSDLKLDSAGNSSSRDRRNSCHSFLTTCKPEWPGDRRSPATCRRRPERLERECATFGAVAREVAASPPGQEHLRMHCAVDEQLWQRVQTAGGRLSLGPWADEMACAVGHRGADGAKWCS